MKMILILCGFFLLPTMGFSQQTMGGIRIYGFSNTDNNPKNTSSIPAAFIMVIDFNGDTIVQGQTMLPYILNYCQPGNYTLFASYENFTPVDNYSFVVSADRITFIDLLFEPEVKKRKKFVTPALNSNQK